MINTTSIAVICYIAVLRIFENSFLREVKYGTFTNTTNLSYINLRNNTIRYVHKNLFSGLHKLRNLDMSFNPIENIAGDTHLAIPRLISA
ncbi:hypothetical protein TrispH2_007255 [Trichoplax sp. H2]|nr:hypothetical protein TrispH2_007255 [Trichoplax sp. H2]|eukprot:RDD40604.1 hypothetical protein TrispH2_007255 [Trichoplax sp. H2]